MLIRFVIGRAGSGKTHWCLEAIRDRLRQNPIDGPRLILLVPEQAGLQMERAILQPPGAPASTGDIPGAHRAEVLSFQRLAYRVLDSVTGAPRRALTEPARAMVLRHLLARRSEQLKYYRRVARQGESGGRFSGLVELLGATIAELIQEAIEPDDLARVAEGAEAQLSACAEPHQSKHVARPDPARQAKLHDLHLIYRAYLDYLGKDRLDPSQHLQAARECLPRCAWLDGAELWVDGFASLSGQEMMTLVALALKCSHVDVTVMMDPLLSQSPPQPVGAASAAGRLFARTCQTYLRLHDRFIQAGLELEDPLVLDSRSPPRFRDSASLAGLERHLFAGARAPCERADAAPAVELIELPSRRIEVDYAVSRVCRWIQGSRGPYRYRDVAVIVRDLEPYHDLLGEALSARGVPFFIDRRRPVSHHPLVELLRAGAAAAAESMSLESVRLALKTGLLPVSTEETDELENYLLAHGIAGLDRWRGEHWSYRLRPALVPRENDEPGAYESEALARINATRKKLVDVLGAWLAHASAGRGRTGADWVTAVIEWFQCMNVGPALKRWADEAEADGDLDIAEEHRQVWREVMSFLDDMAFAFADVELTVAELADVLSAGLSGLTLGLVPPTVDQVLVGSIERSRHPDIKAAVILGFNDGVFPRQLTEDSILNDDDRLALQEAGVVVRPAMRERVLDEALLVYVALTRASESVVVTYSTADNDGKVLRPSPYVHALRAACPDLATLHLDDPARKRETWDVLSQRDLTRRMVMEFRTRPPRSRDDPALRGRWNELYDAVRAELARNHASRRAFASLDDRTEGRISPATIERLYEGPLQTSVSELETYAACPFQHFARYALRLRERAEATLEPVDVGQVHHAVLEDLVGILTSRGLGFEKLSERELLDALQESSARVAARFTEGGVLSDARNAYLLRRTASDLAKILRAQRRRSQGGEARPWAAELPFGFDKKGGLPAMELSTPAGRRVLLRGYIDRVDLVELADELLGIVIDYKRTRDKHLKLERVYHGLSLQLPAYLLVLAELGETLAGRRIRPIGSLYVSLASQYHRVDHPDHAGPRDLSLRGTYRPRGLLLADTFDVLDSSGATGWSDHYSMYRGRDMRVGHIDHSDAADAASFRAVLDHTRLKLGELADGLLDGNVAVNPYRLGAFSPCSWCPMSGVCRFEMGICDVRFLESLKRSEVFQRLTESST